MTNNTRAQALAKLQRLGQEHDAAGGWTPGPWHDKPIHVCAADQHGLRLGFLNTGNAARRAEGIANARLIVAAPDLYAELARLVTALEPLERNGGWPLDSAGVATLNGARAALAKARGEQE